MSSLNIVSYPHPMTNDYNRILNLLTVKDDEGDKYYLGSLGNNTYCLPRYLDKETFTVRKRDEQKVITYNKLLFDNYPIFFKPRNDKQIRTVDYLNNNSEACLKLSTGSGKTKCTINHILSNNLKAIILCHNSKIMSQWEEAIKEMTVLSDEDLYCVSGNYSKKKLLRAKIVIISNKTVSARIKSEKMIEFLTDMFNCRFDTTVIDEAHLALEANNLWLMNVYTPNVYILTATPNRSNRQEDDLIKFIYPIHNTLEIIEYEQPVRTVFYTFDSKPESKDNYYVCLSSKYGLDKNNYFKYIKRDNNFLSYFNMLSGIIDRIRSKYGNGIKFLITGLTIENLNMLYAELSKFPVNKINRYYGEFMEDTRAGDDTNITLTIMSTIQAGYDVSDLNVVINLVPVSSPALIIQLKGRLARTFEGKNLAMYIALVDTGFPNIIRTQTKQMNKILEEGMSEVTVITDNIVFQK